jgi:transcriptional regulator with XRE-family HTH domain
MGAFLRGRRKELGWSRERLAEVSGFSRNHVNKVERGVEVGLGTLVLVCAALDVHPSDAFRHAGL